VQGVDALVLDDRRGGMLERTPLLSAEENEVRASIRVAEAEGGAADVQITLFFRGAPAAGERARLEKRTDEELRRSCRERLGPAYRSAEVLSCQVLNRDALDEPLGLEFRVRAARALRRQGDLVFADPDVLPLADWLPDLGPGTRQYPLELPYPVRITQELALGLPEGSWSVRNLPADVHREVGELDYHRVSGWNEGSRSVLLKAVLRVGGAQITPAEWPAVQGLIGEIRAAQAEEVILVES
jgi:hypothetical protein